MKVYMVSRRLVFGDGGAVSVPMSVFEHEAGAKAAMEEHDRGTAGVLGWTVVSPSGQPVGTLGAFLKNMAILEIAYGYCAVEVSGSALLVPEKRIIMPGK